MRVREIMSRNVECVESGASIKEAAEKMRSLDVGFLPICEDDTVVGTLTDRDITIRHVRPRLRVFVQIHQRSRFHGDHVQD